LESIFTSKNPVNFTQEIDMKMEPATIRAKIAQIENQREFLVKLLEKPDLGTLRIDVNQALEELDELIDEFKMTFPGYQSSN
jgi:hypothetical protein